MDTTLLEQKIKDLKAEQEDIQSQIIDAEHAIEATKQGIKFAQKRLKANESELQYYQGLAEIK